jgi:tetratricopeptide (TPR) repeat protein
VLTLILTTILVFPFENLSNDRSMDWIGEGIAEVVIDKLQADRRLIVFSREERLAAYERLGIPETTMVSRATAVKLGWDMGADAVITGSFSGTAEKLEIVPRIVPLATLSSSDRQELESAGAARIPEYRSAFENYVRGILSADPEKRIQLLQTAVRLHSTYESAIFQLGRAFHAERDFKASNQWLEKLPAGSSYRLMARFAAASNYFNLADYERAVEILEQLPPAYEVLLNLGVAHSLNGDHAAALTAWKRAVELDPLGSDAFFNIGYAGFLRGDFDAAARSLTESLRLRGRDSEALFLLGRSHERLGRLDEAQRATAQATRLSQRVERWLTQPIPRLERFAATTSFRDRSRLWTEERLARRARAWDLTARLEAIQTQIDGSSYGEAIRELRETLRLFPDSAEAQSLLDEVNQRRNSR